MFFRVKKESCFQIFSEFAIDTPGKKVFFLSRLSLFRLDSPLFKNCRYAFVGLDR